MTPSDRTLRLQRPLVVFDLETTGLDPVQDRIVEIACVTLLPDGTRQEWCRRVNPGRPIEPAATAVHGIRDADVAGEPRFEAIAPEAHARFAGADLAGFNVLGFDLALLTNEFRRAGLPFPAEGTAIVDAMKIFQQRERRDLAAAVALYCGRPHKGAHGALADTLATADVLLGQLRHYGDLPTDVPALHAVCVGSDAIDSQGKLVWQQGEAAFTFGKLRGRTLRAAIAQDRSYIQWMLTANFPEELQGILRQALEGRFPQRAGGPALSAEA